MREGHKSIVLLFSYVKGLIYSNISQSVSIVCQLQKLIQHGPIFKQGLKTFDLYVFLNKQNGGEFNSI